jgi:putative transposase
MQRGKWDEPLERRRPGRPFALEDTHIEALRLIVREMPTATLPQIADALNARCATTVCDTTVRRALRAAGIERLRPRPVQAARSATTSPKRYGYKPAHRRRAPEGGFSTSLTDAEWALVADLFERPEGGRGMPPRFARRLMVDACCYVLRTGCAWRLLPTTFPPWGTVYRSFSRWAEQGVFEQMHDRLREQWRLRIGKGASPSAAVLDAQSTRSSPQGGSVGFDAGKKVKGRKRHVLVDTLGLLLAVTITAASVQDRDGAAAVVALACSKVPGLARLYVDGAYAGQCAHALEAAHASLTVEVVRHPANGHQRVFHENQLPLWSKPAPVAGFTPLPKRWVVERTHAWNERSRRLVMHHDRSLVTATAWVWLAEARILANRLA